VDAAFLHALGDMIMSIGVVIAATIIYFFPQYTIADPICTFIFSVIVCFTIYPIVRNCITVLMEGSPPEVDSISLVKDIKALEEGAEIHDFHLWSISVGKFALSAHINSQNPNQMLKEVTMLCKKKYGIDHLTLQMEDTSGSNEHQFECD
jgi:zinc transporter 2